MGRPVLRIWMLKQMGWDREVKVGFYEMYDAPLSFLSSPIKDMIPLN